MRSGEQKGSGSFYSHKASLNSLEGRWNDNRSCVGVVTNVCETDLWRWLLWCVCGGPAQWTSHSLRQTGCSSARPSCSHVRLRLQRTGSPEVGSPVHLTGNCQIYHSARGGGRARIAKCHKSYSSEGFKCQTCYTGQQVKQQISNTVSHFKELQNCFMTVSCNTANMPGWRVQLWLLLSAIIFHQEVSQAPPTKIHFSWYHAAASSLPVNTIKLPHSWAVTEAYTCRHTHVNLINDSSFVTPQS